MRRVSLLLIVLAVAGCDQNMESQPKYDEYKPARIFRNGQTLQAPVPGTVARDDPARAEAIATRPELTVALIERGRERFDIYCAPCHGRTGMGDGMVVQRGMPRPPSLHDERLRAAPDQHVFDVITRGYGVMYSYAMRVQPQDRWAIIAYIRALQLSQHATLADVPTADGDWLAAGSR
jgi:mono/diheme cytochrome c family protein